MEKIYDLIILGGGPASMSAGIYAKQMRLDTLLIEKSVFGGQIAMTSSVSNYLGFTHISGKDLAQAMHDHLLSTGIEIAEEEVTKTELTQEVKVVYTHNNIYRARCVIIGIGTKTRNLGVENENFYLNKGVSYATLKDGNMYAGKNVAVVGGGNSALEDAIYLGNIASKVYLIHRRNEFRGDGQLVEQVKNIANTTGKIELILESKPLSIEGETCVERLNLTHIPDNKTISIDVDGIFIAIGRGADTEIIDENITRQENGYIVTDSCMQTNLQGVYAVGDIRNTPLRQIVTATSDGAIASMMAFNYIKNRRNEK